MLDSEDIFSHITQSGKKDRKSSAQNPLLAQGISVYKSKNYLKALQIFEKLDSEKKNSAEVYYFMALCHCRLARFASARAVFRKVLSSQPDIFFFVQSHMLLAYLDARDDLLDTAEEHIYALLKKNLENAQMYGILGYIYNKRKDFSQAEYYYKKALAIDPENANCHNGIGYNYTEWNTKLDAAQEHLAKAVDLDRDNPAYLDSLGWLYFFKKQFSRAVFFLTKAVRVSDHKEILSHLEQIRAAQSGAHE